MTKIREILNSDEFYIAVDKNIYKLKTNNNKCIFLKNGRCSIYENRPLDCRLYPFDIIKKDSKYYLILYQLDCTSDYKIVDDVNCVNNLIDKIRPWIEDFTDNRNYTKMKNLKYIIIKQIS
jgi:Fe-S-cluster containining protein